jgi:hypothetical protein
MNENEEQVRFTGSMGEVLDGIRDLISKESAGPLRVMYLELGTKVQKRTDGAGPVRITSSPSTLSPGDPGFTLEWNLQGHAVIGYMAQSILQQESPDVSQRLQAAIAADPDARGDIGDLAMWPDRIKHPPPGAYQDYEQRGWIQLGKQTQPMHFVDIPYDPKSSASPQIPSSKTSPTILVGLPQYLQQLQAWPNARDGADALGFVIHFAGDIHQPLHCACLAQAPYSPPDYDKGGNLIAWGNSQKNPPSLHSFWDDAVASRPSDVLRQVAALLAKYPRSHFENDLTVQDVKDWALDSYSTARIAYDRFLHESTYDSATQRYSPPSQAYRQWATEVAEERVALAGYRLADLLANYLPPMDKIAARTGGDPQGEGAAVAPKRSTRGRRGIAAAGNRKGYRLPARHKRRG